MMDTFESLTGMRRNKGRDLEGESGPLGPAGGKMEGFNAQMGNLLMGDVMERAMNDKVAELEEKPVDAEDADEDGDGAAGADDGDYSDDDGLTRIREARMKQMREAAKKKQEYLTHGHGEYNEIKEDEFLPTVTKSMRAVVHFYHKDFESCKVADMHMGRMAKKFIGTKFAKLEAEKAPFFVTKLQIQTLPTMACFVDGKLIYKQHGFLGVENGETNDFKTAHLARIIRNVGLIEENFDSDDEI